MSEASYWQMMGEAERHMAEPIMWPADGAAGVCPDCNQSVHFVSDETSTDGLWFHLSGTVDCDARLGGDGA